MFHSRINVRCTDCRLCTARTFRYCRFDWRGMCALYRRGRRCPYRTRDRCIDSSWNKDRTHHRCILARSDTGCCQCTLASMRMKRTMRRLIVEERMCRFDTLIPLGMRCLAHRARTCRWSRIRVHWDIDLKVRMECRRYSHIIVRCIGRSSSTVRTRRRCTRSRSDIGCYRNTHRSFRSYILVHSDIARCLRRTYKDCRYTAGYRIDYCLCILGRYRYCR